MYRLIGHGKVYNYFEGGNHHHPKRNYQWKKCTLPKKTKSKNKRVDFPFHTTSALRDHYFIGEGKHALEGLRPFT